MIKKATPYKFQIRYIETGEIEESDYIYKYPHTAKAGARAIINEHLKFNERRKDELADLKIISSYEPDNPTIHLGGKPMKLSTVEAWLRGDFREV